MDYIGQFEDDLADLIEILREQVPGTDLIIGGHSSGGGLTVRFAGSEYTTLSDGYILLSPFLKYNAPTTRPNSGGWAHPLSRRIAGLEDEAFIAEAYQPTIESHTDTGTYLLLPNLGHIDLLTDQTLFEVTSDWLSGLH